MNKMLQNAAPLDQFVSKPNGKKCVGFFIFLTADFIFLTMISKTALAFSLYFYAFSLPVFAFGLRLNGRFLTGGKAFVGNVEALATHSIFISASANFNPSDWIASLPERRTGKTLSIGTIREATFNNSILFKLETVLRQCHSDNVIEFHVTNIGETSHLLNQVYL